MTLISQDRTITLVAGGSIQGILNDLGPTLDRNVIINVAGTRTTPIVFTTGGTVLIQKTTPGGTSLTIQADDSAYSGILTPPAGGFGADFITVAKGSLGWSAGDWYSGGVSAKLVILTTGGDATAAGASGNVRDLANGITESNASGGVGNTHWKFTVASNFSTSSAADATKIRFAVFASVFYHLDTYPVFKFVGYTPTVFQNIGLQGSVHALDGADVKFGRSGIFGVTIHSGLAVTRSSVSNVGSYPLHICGCATWGFLCGDNGVLRLQSSEGYIGGNGYCGVAAYSPGFFDIRQYSLDRTTNGIVVENGSCYMASCTFTSSTAAHRNINAKNNAFVYVYSCPTVNAINLTNGAVSLS